LNDSGLLRTTDGGATWEQILGPSLYTVHFLTADVGWGVVVEGRDSPVRAGRLLKTEDGGATWMAPQQQIEVLSVCFATDKLGWAAGPHEAGAALFRTEDGRACWTEIPIPMPGGDYTGWLATVRCGGDAAWVLAQGDAGAGHIAYAVFRIAEGESEPEPCLQDAYTHPLGQGKGVPEASNPYPGPLTAPDDQSARFITWCPACGGDLPFVSLERTQDGGGTWTDPTVLDSNEPAEPVGISFLDRDQGWILARDLETNAMVVLRTSDGGLTWDRL
jgi:hypothetical protein